MMLSLDETATRLGKSRRQVEYMIKTGRLQASKINGRWQVDDSTLPDSPARKKALDQRQRKLRNVVDDALAIPRDKVYSVRDLQLWQRLAACYQTWPDELPARQALSRAMRSLARASHRYRRDEKLLAFRRTRDHLCDAIWLLEVHQSEQTTQHILQIEDSLLPLLAGLIRRTERKRR